METLLISCAVGLVIAFVVSFSFRAQLKSVHFQNEASSYVRKDSVNVDERSEYYTYSTRSVRSNGNVSSKNTINAHGGFGGPGGPRGPRGF